MLQETLEPAWLDAFQAVPGRCAVRTGDTVAILSESQGRPATFSTAPANEVAGRHTLGHFDLPLRHCTVQLDGTTVVEQGRILE